MWAHAPKTDLSRSGWLLLIYKSPLKYLSVTGIGDNSKYRPFIGGPLFVKWSWILLYLGHLISLQLSAEGTTLRTIRILKLGIMVILIPFN